MSADGKPRRRAATLVRARRVPGRPGAGRSGGPRHHDRPFFLYLGRHVGLPVCLEGALKLLVHHVARLRRHDIDRPRNLAKTVTVE